MRKMIPIMMPSTIPPLLAIISSGLKFLPLIFFCIYSRVKPKIGIIPMQKNVNFRFLNEIKGRAVRNAKNRKCTILSSCQALPGVEPLVGIRAEHAKRNKHASQLIGHMFCVIYLYAFMVFASFLKKSCGFFGRIVTNPGGTCVRCRQESCLGLI